MDNLQQTPEAKLLAAILSRPAERVSDAELVAALRLAVPGCDARITVREVTAPMEERA